MKTVRNIEGELYTPEGHDKTVLSRKLFNPLNGCEKIDVHVTTFSPGAGMDEEIHEESDHVFFILSGVLSVYQHGKLIHNLEKGDAVHISAGEPHEVRNNGDVEGVFLAITTI